MSCFFDLCVKKSQEEIEADLDRQARQVILGVPDRVYKKPYCTRPFLMFSLLAMAVGAGMGIGANEFERQHMPFQMGRDSVEEYRGLNDLVFGILGAVTMLTVSLIGRVFSHYCCNPPQRMRTPPVAVMNFSHHRGARSSGGLSLSNVADKPNYKPPVL